MKSIEERAKEAGIICQYKSDYCYDKRSVDYGYTLGATEQKNIDEEVRLKKCDDMTEAEYDREVAFADWYNKNGKGIPTYSDAIEWARRELIDEACDLKEMPSLAELGCMRKCANYVLAEIGDISTMTKNEIVNAIVRKVFEYSKKEKL